MTRIIKKLPLPAAAASILFLLVQIGCTLTLPLFTARMVNEGIVPGNIPAILSLGGTMLALTCLSLVGAVLNTLIAARISYRLGSQLREELYARVLGFSHAEFDRIGTASLTTRNTNDVTQVQNLVEMGLKFLILCPLYLVGGIAMTWLLSPSLALVFLSAIPFLLLAAVMIYRFANPLYSRIQKLVDTLNLYFREGLTGVRVIRAFRREQDDAEKFEAVNETYRTTSVKAGTIMSVFVPLITLLMNLTTIAIVWIGGQSVAAGAMEIGTIMGAVTYAAQILLGFKILSMVILAVPKGQVSAGRILEVLDMPLSIRDPEQPAQAAPQGPLVFEHIDFRYQGAEKRTLEGISFAVQPGQTLAVIGSTGDGKTTLVNLISRLYDVEQGCVRIGGVDIRDMQQSVLRGAVSLASQKSTLFQGTVRSNLLLAKPDATDDALWQALELACARGFVERLGQGLDAPVAKGGANFSGGQKQRLCIARALLKDAHIYVFDDSFSALDFKTDAAVRANMREKLSRSIGVIVAQRISTVLQADLIAVLENGRLAGLGTHQQLKKNNPVYQEILLSQQCEEAAV